MDSIESFLEKFNLNDSNLKNYTHEVIEGIAKIIGGDIENNYDNKILLNYAGLYYEYCFDDKLDLVEKYFLMGAEKDHIDSIGNLASMYHRQMKNYKLAEKYYIIGVNKGNSTAMYNLAYMYEHEMKNYELAEKYYMMSIEKGNMNAIDNMMQMYENHFKDKKIKLYHKLKQINRASEKLNKKIRELENDYRILCFRNKQQFLSKTDECPICMCSVLLIPCECTHYICCDCFIMIDKCPICKCPSIGQL